MCKYFFGTLLSVLMGKIRVNGKDKKYLAHTLNNTVVAPPRMLIAFLENNLNEDGSILTEKGTEVGKKITDKINFVLDEICIDLTEEQREEFYRSLAIISDSLELCTKGIQSAKKIKTKSNS